MIKAHTHPRRTAVRLFLLALVAAIPLPGQSAKSLSKAELEDLIRQYILDHGDTVMQAVNTYQAKQRDMEGQRAKAAVQTRRSELVHDAATPVRESVTADPERALTIVEFFDYHCGYCKRNHATLNKILADNPGVRLVFKEFPILGAESLLGAKAALAARNQGAYLQFHDALMSSTEPITVPAIDGIAGNLGLDAAKLRADMEAPATQALLDRNKALAEELAVHATPTFVVGSEVVAGGMDGAAFQALIDRVLAGTKAGGPAPVKAGL